MAEHIMQGYDPGQNLPGRIMVGADLEHEDAAASSVVFNAEARLAMIAVRNLNAAARWLMIFNAAALPANGTVPDLLILPLAAGEIKTYAPPAPVYFSTGLVWAMSTTDTTLTVTGTNDGEVDTFTVPIG